MSNSFVFIQKLLHESVKLLRNLFLKKFKESTSSEWNDNEDSGKYFETTPDGKSILKNSKFESQKKYLIKGDSNLWDLSLLRLIFSCKPFRDEKSFKHIKVICNTRNEIFHNSRFTLSNEEFDKLWSDLSDALINLGYRKENLDKLKNKKVEITNVNDEVKRLKYIANEEFLKRNYDEAIKLYTEALKLHEISDKDLSTLYLNRSFAIYKIYTNSRTRQDDRSLLKALGDALNASYLNPQWYKPYARLGLIYSSLSDLEKAEENFELAFILSNNDEEIKNYLADVRLKSFEQSRKSSY